MPKLPLLTGNYVAPPLTHSACPNVRDV